MTLHMKTYILAALAALVASAPRNRSRRERPDYRLEHRRDYRRRIVGG